MQRIIFILLFCYTLSMSQSLNPRKLLIYYGYPSLINNAQGNVNVAAETLGKYDFVVLGDGLEKAAHSDHNKTVQIIQLLHQNYSTKVFGYIDLGVSTKNLTLDSIGTCIQEWQASGADGIFLDDFGYDYDVSRIRQNAAVDSVHKYNLSVCANGWDPDDVFGDAVDPTYNPTGEPTHLNSNDVYLSESYQIQLGNYASETDWISKADKLRNYQQTIGFSIWSITTTTSSVGYDQNKFHYAWYSALLYGHQATGWGEPYFSASNSEAPYRTRPTVNSGTFFGNEIYHESALHYRYTDMGKIWVKTDDHTYGFSDGDTPLPVQLQEFSARQVADSVVLEWSTQAEINNAGFILQRKIGSKTIEIASYKQLPTLKGQGNSTHPAFYRYVDAFLPGSDSAYYVTYFLLSAEANGNTHLEARQRILFLPQMNAPVKLSGFRLLPGFPNPFNCETTIRWEAQNGYLPQPVVCEIIIFSITGQKVRSLFRGTGDGEKGEVRWDGTDENGNRVSSGVYFVMLRAGTFRTMQKIVLSK